MRELDFLPTWYVQLNRERRLLRRSISVGVLAIVIAVSLQGGAAWMLTRSRAALVRSRQQSARLTAAEARTHALRARRDRLQIEYEAWARAAAPVSAVALSCRLGQLLPGNVTLTQLKLGPADRARAGAVHLSGVAADEVNVAAVLLSLNGDRKFEQVLLGPVKDQRLQGQSMKRFELSFVASADTEEAAP